MRIWHTTKKGLAVLLAVLLAGMTIAACGGGGGSAIGGGTDLPTVDGTGSIAVSIENPGAPEAETSDETMTLQGTAASAMAVTAVSWRSNRGATGQASGTEEWQASGVPLELGSNRITVTASDTAGNQGSASIVIHRESKGKKSVTLDWTAPTQRTDGTALTNLAGYEIHYGRMSKTYDYEIRIDNPGVLSYVVEGLNPGYWYFSMTAFDRDGGESKLSNEARMKVE